jgi:inorganic pyrophosphatase
MVFSENPSTNEEFFQALEKLIEGNGITIDRPKGKAHPRFPDLIYPLQYGYINGTLSQDGQGIDLFRGDDPSVGVVGVAVTVDNVKRDAEVKVLYRCTEENIQTAMKMVTHEPMRALLVRRWP